MAEDTVVLQDQDTLLLFDADTLYTTFDDAVGTGCDHLNEDGGLSLNEDGGVSILEGCPTASNPVGAKHQPSHETRTYWENERDRLRVLRDDDEILMLV